MPPSSANISRRVQRLKRRSARAAVMVLRGRRPVFGFGVVRLWLIALVIGAMAAYGAIFLRMVIDAVSLIAFGETEEMMASGAGAVGKVRAFLAPVIGGFAVAGLLYLSDRFKWLTGGRGQGIAQVIEARAVRDGAISWKTGLAAAAVSAVSLGAGASAGREGPAVHFGATIASFIDRNLGFTAHERRTLLGCGAAAAVSASFNAPIAGVLFALEVIMGNYALSIFGPIAAASVMGAIIARTHLGNSPAFEVPVYGAIANIDVPLSALLGLMCGLVACLFLILVKRLTNWSRAMADRRGLNYLYLPPLGGVIIGSIGIFFPEIFGVSYEAVTRTLAGDYTLRILFLLLILKMFATAVTLSARFGGGVFSPGLVMGALVGAAFGGTLNAYIPGSVADPAFYAMVGMGAASGAIIGAPISTTLIVFELTGDYGMTISLMVAVALATLVVQSLIGKTFFHWQLSRRGYDLSEGPQGVILQTIRVRDVMDKMPPGTPLAKDAPRLLTKHSLGEAIARLEKLEEIGLPVVEEKAPAESVGYLTRVKALASYNRALVDSHIEHHR
ncbi:MAG: chloride channel protein [Pseudomonadota bacterium]